MSPLSRAAGRWHPLRVASVSIGLMVLIMVAAYVVGAAVSQPSLGGVVSAVCFAAIAGTGLLYAWRLGAGAPVD